MQNKDIEIALQKLREQDLTDDEAFNAFYTHLKMLCEKFLRSQQSRGYKKHMNEIELLHSFYEILVTQCTLGWKTTSHLNREIQRLYVRKTNPAASAFWQTISTAVNSLVKEGLCEKSEEFRHLNNTNETVIFKKGCFQSDLKDRFFVEDCKNIPEFPKLTPKNAKELVSKILDAVSAPITMGTIIEICRTKTAIYQETSFVHEDENGKPYETIHGTVWDDHNKAAQRLESFDIRITDEAENRTRLIWAEVDSMEVGRSDKIPGSHVLCLYYLPKIIFQRKVTLKDWGKPESTIQDATTRIASIIKKYMSEEGFNNTIILEIFRKVLALLFEYCSEKQLDQHLNMAESK